MMAVVKEINFKDVEEALPAFFTMAFIPFTYSLVNGIALGLVTHTAIGVFNSWFVVVSKKMYRTMAYMVCGEWVIYNYVDKCLFARFKLLCNCFNVGYLFCLVYLFFANLEERN